MRKTLAIAAFLALVACTPAGETTKPSQDMVSAESAAAITDPAECAAKGGSIRPVCRKQTPTCVLVYKDVGKECSDDADCEGKCLLAGDPPTDPNAKVTGQCQAESDPCGCNTEIKGGKAQATLCVD